MNGPGDLPLQHYSSTPEANNCSIISIIPTLGMSSCRGRAEAFARRLSSKLRTLGSQNDESDNSQEDEQPIINGTGTPSNNWVTGHETAQAVTALQPLRHESDSFFDFDCELESPGSPVDECEYLRLIESTSNTPHTSAPESGYACASAASSHSSTDGPYFDVNSENEGQSQEKHIKKENKIPQAPAVPAAVECDEVDFVKPAQQLKQASQCNGHDDHQRATESHQATSNSVTTTLPNEAPDIEQTKLKQNKPESIIKSERNPSLQDQILRELQIHSQEKTDEELEAEEKKIQETLKEDIKPQIVDLKENEIKNTCPKVIHSLINGQAENGEEVLKVEVCEVAEPPKSEQQPEQAKEIVVKVEEITSPSAKELPKEEPQSQELAQKSETSSETKDKPEIKIKHANLHHDTTDEDEEDSRPQRVRRCSSLKTGKTPPGTPGRKKIVRFADVLGLDLADVKTFLDEVPTIPKSAYEDLEVLENEPPIQLGPKPDKLLMPLFQQPGGLANFLDAVKAKQVSLENAAVADTINHTITGSVRVRNLDFHKSVHIRYSLDGWRSYADLQANYVENSCDGFSDKFTFVLFGNSLHIGQRLEFAVRFQCKGQQYWDNNYGSNYCFQCLPTSTVPAPVQVLPSHHNNNMVGLLSPTAGEAWCSSFY